MRDILTGDASADWSIDTAADAAFEGRAEDNRADGSDMAGEQIPGETIEPDAVEVTEGFRTLNAVVFCPVPTPVCSDPDDGSTLHASYRKDDYLDNETYDTELKEYPLNGGRIHIAAISQVTGRVTGVQINGTPVEEMLADLKMDWRHVWPENAVQGQPIWFAFHSRDAHWDQVESGTLTIQTDQGVAVDGEFPVGLHPIRITYVTVDDSAETILIHVQNTSPDPQTLTGLLWNGVERLQGGGACVPNPTIRPGQSALWTVPLCEPAALGSPWTLVMEFLELPTTATVGRVLRPFFPIEAWQKGDDCPLPGVNNDAFHLYTQGGLDTFYFYWGSGQKCGYDNAVMFNDVLPATGVNVLLGDDFPWDDPPLEILLDTSAIAGVLTGDESDWSYVTADGLPKPETKASRGRKVWNAFPELLTYNGAMTDKHVGAFAGMTDVQGIDVYAAGCAPHIWNWGDGPPLKAPYDFLKNARNNHMPWPTWLYSQGLGNWSVMPDPQEILVQGIQVLLAGGKGLMWFQVGMKMIADHPDTWDAISDVNWMVRSVRPWVREGDLADLARSDEDVIVDAIRSRDAIVVPMVTLKAREQPTDEKCVYYALGMIENEDEVHWMMEDRLVQLTLEVPEDMGIADLFEVRPGIVVEILYPVHVVGRTIQLSDIPLDNTTPARIFVFASHSGVRTRAEELNAPLESK
jgi:hypothetical protein